MLRYLGVDWGEKRIGLALADSEGRLASTYKTVKTVSDLLKVVLEENIDHLILGQPRTLRGEDCSNEAFNKFYQILQERLPTKVEIDLMDERLSSIQADGFLNNKLKQNRDNLAAMIILQSYLDKIYAQD